MSEQIEAFKRLSRPPSWLTRLRSEKTRFGFHAGDTLPKQTCGWCKNIGDNNIHSYSIDLVEYSVKYYIFADVTSLLDRRLTTHIVMKNHKDILMTHTTHHGC